MAEYTITLTKDELNDLRSYLIELRSHLLEFALLDQDTDRLVRLVRLLARLNEVDQ